MNQKRNKIIVLIGIIIALGILIYYLNYYSNSGSYLQRENLRVYKSLQSKCPIATLRTFAVCKYATDNTIIPVEISLPENENNIQYSDYFVKENEKVILNFDLENILKNKNYNLINSNLDSNLSLCLSMSSKLSDFKIYSQNEFRIIGDQFLCFKSFSKNFNSPKFVIEGNVPNVEIDKWPFVIDVYKMPKDFDFDAVDKTALEKEINSKSFLIKIIPFRISK